jgi:FkbM family methyltransferase
MRIYRNSRFHSQKMGRFLAKLLSIYVGINKDKIKIKRINGILFRLDLRQVIDASLFFSNTYEESEEHLIDSIVTTGMYVIDIGANFGYHTFRMAKLVGPKGKVLAVEPTSWAFDKLMINAKLNPTIKNIRYLKIALAEKDLGRHLTKITSSYQINGKEEKSKEVFEMRKLDTVVFENKFTHIDFIKLDVDGYEAKVLRGATKTVSRLRPTILIEITPAALENNHDSYLNVVKFFEQYNYRFETTSRYPIPNLDKLCMQLPQNTSIMVLAIPCDRS